MSQRAITRQFFGQHLEHAQRAGFGHEPRWRGAAALKRLFSADARQRPRRRIRSTRCWPTCRPSLARGRPLAQDQYLEVHTLLSGYLLSSQGDRMLMANSVEGRFPFLDRQVAALAESLPPSTSCACSTRSTC